MIHFEDFDRDQDKLINAAVEIQRIILWEEESESEIDNIDSESSADTRNAFMITESTITLKTAYLNAFYNGSLKIKMFIVQLNNKFMNAVKVTDKRKIRYAMSLLRNSALEWAAIFITA